MPNGGDSGRQLDRLQDQVDATRTELGEVAEAVNGLRELVGELTRKSWSEHQADRWQAKLGSLETRLGMMETTIRSEVERMRAAAGAVDALADEFRSTVGDTQNLVGLASDIGDRLDLLAGLERSVRGAAQDVATSVSDRLDRDASNREQRERELADRIADTIAGSRQAVAELADRLDTIARATSELPSVEERLSAQVRQAGSWGDAIDRISTDVSGVSAGVSGVTAGLSGLSSDLASLRSDLDASNEAARRATLDALRVMSTELEAFESRLAANSQDERLEQIIGAVTQLRSDQPQLASRLEEVTNELSSLQHALTQPLASVEGISDRVDALAATLRSVVSSQPDPRPQLEQLVDAVSALRTEQPDIEGLADRLSAQITELRAAQPDHREALQRIAELVAALPREVPDPRDALDRVATELAELRTSQPDHRETLDRLAGDLAELRANQPDHRDELQRLTAVVSALRTETVDPSEALANLSTELAEFRAWQPDLRPQLDRILGEFSELRATQPDLRPQFDRVLAELAELRTARPDHAEALQQLTAMVSALPIDRVDPTDTLARLAAEIAELRAAQPDTRPQLDRILAELTDIRTTSATAAAPQLDRILAELSSLRAEPPGADAIAGLVAEITALRSDRPDVDGAVARIRDDIQTLREALTDLRASQPSLDTTPLEQRVDALAGQLGAQLEDLRAAQPQLDVDLDPLAQQITDLGSRVDEQLTALRLREVQPVDLAPLLARLDDAATQLTQLRAAQPATDAVIGRIASSLHEQSEALSQVQAPHPQLVVRLDNLARDLAELTERQQALSQLSQRFDQLGADLVERVQTAAPELERQLERVQAELADFRARQTDPAAALAPIAERLERVADDVGRLQQPEPALARVTEELAALRAAQIDPSIAQNFLAERLDRVLAEIAALRNEQPGTASTDAAIQPLVLQVDQLRAALVTLREELQGMPAPVADVAGALAPLGDRLVALDDRAAATGDRVAQLEGQLSRTTMQLDELMSVVTGLRDTPVDAAGALAPLADRLAVVVDAVSSLHGDVAGLADAMSTMRTERTGLAQLAADTTARLDHVTASLAELHESRLDSDATNEQLQQLGRAIADLHDSRPDLTLSFSVLTDLVESLQTTVTDTRNRIDALHEYLRPADGNAELAALLAPVIDRLDSLGARAAVSEAQIGTTLDDLADTVTRFDSEQSEAVRTHIDELRQAVHALGDRQANALMDVVQRFEQVSANASDTQEAIRSIDAAISSLSTPRDDARDVIGDLAQQMAALTADVRSSVRSVVGLGADLTALRSDVETLTVAMPDVSDTEAAMRAALTSIDQSIAERDRRMREFLQQLDASVGSRDADVRTALTTLSEVLSTTPSSSDASSVAAQLDAGLTELRRELQALRQESSNSEVLAAVRSLGERDRDREPSPVVDVGSAVEPLSHALRDVRADVQSTRVELQSISRTVEELRSESRRPDDVGGGAGAALVASAATAMARLEARMDGEFDSIGQQMEALGTLLGQLIDSVHRVEEQVIGAHPMTERVRHSAASVLDALRTNVRQRQAHRNRPQGPPPELGSGPRSY
ncbi:MAG TPA: hypothetical protein VFV00_13260 [Acidimicrobiales bacterium]|nr:hypothetical protein [Acidimicrobiales bacterium]